MDKQVVLMGNEPPYGYKCIDGRLVVDEEEVGVVRAIYQRYVAGDDGSIRKELE